MLNTDSTLKGQLIFLAERASELLHENMITDRTVIDVMAFSHLSITIPFFISADLNKAVSELIRDYDYIFYVSPEGVELEDNGVRVVDSEYRMELDKTIKKLLEQHKFKFNTITGYTDFDSKGVRAFRLYSGSGAGIVDLTSNPELTTVSGNVVTFVVTASLPTAVNLTDAVVKYNRQPTDTTRGDFEDGATSPNNGEIKIPEINVSLASEAIVAKTRKLKAQWTPEFAQDLNAYHSIDCRYVR